MSAFTEWESPNGVQPRTADLLALTEAYNRLSSEFNAHANKQASDVTDVHNIKEYLDGKLAILRREIPSVAGYLKELDANETFAKKTDLDGLARGSEVTGLEDHVNEALRNYLRESDLDTNQVIEDIRDDINTAMERLDRFDAWLANPTAPSFKATGVVEGMLKAIEQVTFTDRRINAIVGGSDNVGVYYLLGQLSDKAGVAFVKFQDTHPFSAAINFSVTPEFTGALSVTCDSDLPGLKFKIVSSTDRDNVKRAYLAIQSTEWLAKFASPFGVGVFEQLPFDVSGVNFIPIGSAEWARPASPCNNVCDCHTSRGLSFSELGTPVLGKNIFREPGNPFVTVDDLKALDTVGCISDWPEYDPDTLVAVNVPEGYHVCDGTPVLPEDDVSDKFREKYTNYPLQDAAIIKTRSTIDVKLKSVERSDIADVISKLHGVNLYYGLASLPATANVGEQAIVQMGDKFVVYAFTENDGWQPKE